MLQTETITEERLKRWALRLKQNHATPVLLLAVGHEQTSGKIVLCTCEGISNESLLRFLECVGRELYTV